MQPAEHPCSALGGLHQGPVQALQPTAIQPQPDGCLGALACSCPTHGPGGLRQRCSSLPPFKRVVETGRPALAANGVNVQLSELIDSTHDASHRQPELQLLPAKRKDFGEMFLPGVALPWGITLVQSAALPAKAEDADMCEVVTVHDTPAYYNGRPWYSNVAVDVAEEGGEHATFYAQLRLLFWWGSPHGFGLGKSTSTTSSTKLYDVGHFPPRRSRLDCGPNRGTDAD
ncbi:hypothetical protein V8C86DRAFT_3030123 [Haematococcus lacustris]